MNTNSSSVSVDDQLFENNHRVKPIFYLPLSFNPITSKFLIWFIGIFVPIAHLVSLVIFTSLGFQSTSYYWLLFGPIFYFTGSIMAASNQSMSRLPDPHNRVGYWFASCTFLYIFLLAILGGFHQYMTYQHIEETEYMQLVNRLIFRCSLPILICLVSCIIVMQRQVLGEFDLPKLPELLIKQSEISFLEHIILQLLDTFSLLDESRYANNEFLQDIVLFIAMLSLIFLAVSISDESFIQKKNVYSGSLSTDYDESSGIIGAPSSSTTRKSSLLSTRGASSSLESGASSAGSSLIKMAKKRRSSAVMAPIDDSDRCTRGSAIANLFDILLKKLLSKSKNIKNSALLALGRTNPSVYHILIDHMYNYFNITYTAELKSLKKKPDSQLHNYEYRLIIISHLLRSLVRNAPSSAIGFNQRFRLALVDFIENAHKYLEDFLHEWHLQTLRFNFSTVIRCVCDDIKKHNFQDCLGADTRVEIFTFLSKLAGYGPSAKENKIKHAQILSEEMESFASSMEHKDSKKKSSHNAQSEQQMILSHSIAQLKFVYTQTKLAVHYTICRALSSILHGSDAVPTSFLAKSGPVFLWVCDILNSPNNSFFLIGQKALVNMLAQRPQLLIRYIDRCYYSPTAANKGASRGFFLALVNVYLTNKLKCDRSVILNLCLSELTNESKSVRVAATKLLSHLFRSIFDADLPVNSTSSLNVTYSGLQLHYSLRIAREHPELTNDMINEVIYRILSNKHEGMRIHMFRSLEAWALNITFERMQRALITQQTSQGYEPDMSQIEKQARALMSRLFQVLFNLTHVYHSKYPAEIASIWYAIASYEENIPLVLEYLKQKILCKKPTFETVFLQNLDAITRATWQTYSGRLTVSPPILPLLKRISVYLARKQPHLTIDHLAQELTLRSSQKAKLDFTPVSLRDMLRGVDSPTKSVIEPVVPRLNSGELSLVLLSEFAYETIAEFIPYFPTILHVSLLGLDNSSFSVRAHSAHMLTNMLHSVVLKDGDLPIPSSGAPEDSHNSLFNPIQLSAITKRAQNVVSLLIEKGFNKKIPLWKNEDASLAQPRPSSVKRIHWLIKQLMSILGHYFPDLLDKWKAEALVWATNCSSSHIAARSWQIYRGLGPDKSTASLSKTLESLRRWFRDSHTSSKSSNEDSVAQISFNSHFSVVLEILVTLDSISESLNEDGILQLPQLFWAIVSILFVDIPAIYSLGLTILSKLLKKFDWLNPEVSETLLNFQPDGISNKFFGLQPLIVKGLVNPQSEPIAFDLLCSCISSIPDSIFDPSPSRLLTTITCLLPRLCLLIQDLADQGTQKRYSYYQQAAPIPSVVSALTVAHISSTSSSDITMANSSSSDGLSFSSFSSGPSVTSLGSFTPIDPKEPSDPHDLDSLALPALETEKMTDKSKRTWNQAPLTPRSRKVFESVITRVFNNLSSICAGRGVSRLPQLFARAAQGEYTSPEALIRDIRGPLIDSFFKGNEILIFSILFEMLRIGPSYTQPMLLIILEAFLRDRDLKNSPLASTYTALFAPVVASFEMNLHVWQEALSVLDMGIHISDPRAKVQVVDLTQEATQKLVIPKLKKHKPRLVHQGSQSIIDFTINHNLKQSTKQGDIFWNQPECGIPFTLNFLSKTLNSLQSKQQPLSSFMFTTYFDNDPKKKQVSKSQRATTSGVTGSRRAPFDQNPISPTEPFASSPRSQDSDSQSHFALSPRSNSSFESKFSQEPGFSPDLNFAQDPKSAYIDVENESQGSQISSISALSGYSSVSYDRDLSSLGPSGKSPDTTPRHRSIHKLNRNGPLSRVASQLAGVDGRLNSFDLHSDHSDESSSEHDDDLLGEFDTEGVLGQDFDVHSDEDLDDIYDLLDD